MGIKHLWTVLTPFCERKPIYELQGKVVAIDLAGWVCESLNVVDYFVHPRQYLKNLFFRTCYLLLEGVIPVFILEGTPPELKQQVIEKRNDIQFRGVKPRNDPKQQTDSVKNPKPKKLGRTRFNFVLKQCEVLLQCMGLKCLQGPGEAEAYCAFLNKNGLVDGVISQDSDCFAYGARRVYRNFSVSSQGSASAQGGAVDVYDIEKVKQAMDFGQNKIIAMALLCGCDYCPEGANGVGKENVLKLFARFNEAEILDRLKSWRTKDKKYTTLEIKVDDKNICSNCGHLGKTITHTKKGCISCKTSSGCDSNLWRDERLSIKAELVLRKKALLVPGFPSQEIIDEFLREPDKVPQLNLQWMQPNLVKFIKQVGNLLQWPEIYCFQKFLPLLTRWQVNYISTNRSFTGIVTPDFIKKKRTPKGVASFEIIWKDEKNFFAGLIPDDQIESFITETPGGLEALWSTIEPISLVEKSYQSLAEEFYSKQKKPKRKPAAKTKRGNRKILKEIDPNSDSLSNMSDLLEATEEIKKTIKTKKSKAMKGIQKIDKFLIQKRSSPLIKKSFTANNCSTPKADSFVSNFDSDSENDFDFSNIIQGIISKPNPLSKYAGKRLKYDQIKTNEILNQSKDDLYLLSKKRNHSITSINKTSKKIHLSKSFESFIQNEDKNVHSFKGKNNGDSDLEIIELDDDEEIFKPKNIVNRFLYRESKTLSSSPNKEDKPNVSYFFGNVLDDDDEFEKSLNLSCFNVKKVVDSDSSSSSEL